MSKTVKNLAETAAMTPEARYDYLVEQVKEQLTREEFPLPTLMLNSVKNNIFEMTMQDIHLENYQSHGAIKAKMAV